MVIIDSSTGKRAKSEVLEIRLWNSGDKPIKDLPITLNFRSPYRGDPVFGIKQYPVPFYEFGKISPDSVVPTDDGSLHRFRYELLNPGDEVTMLAAVKNNTVVNLYAKAEDLVIKREGPTSPIRSHRQVLIFTLLAIGAMMVGLARIVNWKAVVRFGR
jgi:hypothetical protein